jgi:DUF1680 family protein
VSYLPTEGRINLYPRSGKPLNVRLPKWLRMQEVTVNGPSALRQTLDKSGNFMRISGATPGTRITLTFKPREENLASDIANRHYEVTWRADSVIKLEPAGKPYPIYKNDTLPEQHLLPEFDTLLYKQPKVRW